MSKETVTLRHAAPADAPAIRELTRAAYAKWVPVPDGSGGWREPKPMTADYTKAVRNHHIDLLYLDGALAAVIEMIPATNHLLIENVAVSPLFQGRGLGRRLMAHSERLAASLGHDETRLYTNKRFAGNLQFYGKLGYQVDREEDFAGSVIVHMSKSVRRSGLDLDLG